MDIYTLIIIALTTTMTSTMVVLARQQKKIQNALDIGLIAQLYPIPSKKELERVITHIDTTNKQRMRTIKIIHRILQTIQIICILCILYILLLHTDTIDVIIINIISFGITFASTHIAITYIKSLNKSIPYIESYKDNIIEIIHTEYE